MNTTRRPEVPSHRSSIFEVFLVFLRLGLTSFGGPVAHLGYFREEFVARRKWLDERTYADLVALCQFLPGPASSQVGIATGLYRAGYLGALAAWTAFTLPSAIALVLFAYGVTAIGDAAGIGWLQGLKIAAVAVVAQAVLGMARSLTPDRERATLAVAAAIIALAAPNVWGQIGAIIFGGLVGLTLLRGRAPVGDHIYIPLPVGRAAGIAALVIFFALLIGLPIIAKGTSSNAVLLFDSFYRSGSLVFGGGHVVLPLLQAEVVPPGWVTTDDVSCRIRRCAGCAGTALHVCRLSRSRHWRLGNGSVLPDGNLPAVVFARDRNAAVLGGAASHVMGAISAARH